MDLSVQQKFSSYPESVVVLLNSVRDLILNVAKQDYQPQGASVTLMISEEAQPESLVAHIDKSHICIYLH